VSLSIAGAITINQAFVPYKKQASYGKKL